MYPPFLVDKRQPSHLALSVVGTSALLIKTMSGQVCVSQAENFFRPFLLALLIKSHKYNADELHPAVCAVVEGCFDFARQMANQSLPPSPAQLLGTDNSRLPAAS